MTKDVNKSYSKPRDNLNKKNLGRERDLGSSSSSSKISNELLGVLKGKEDRSAILGDSLESRFENKFEIPYESSPGFLAKLKKGLWLQKRRHIMDWIIASGVTYHSRLYHELNDNDYNVSKSTLSHFIQYLIDYEIVEFYDWFPMSKNYHYTRWIIAPQCSKERILTIIGDRMKVDRYYYEKYGPKTPKEIVNHNIKVKKETKIANEYYEQEEKQKLKNKLKCEHGFGPQECGVLEVCQNYKWKRLIRDS